MELLLAVLSGLTLHPLHTTLTQLAYRDADRTVEATVRVFADDFRAALGQEVTDSAAAAYLRSTFTLADPAGRPLAIAWCGLRRTGDLLWLCLRAPTFQGVTGLRVRVTLLFERYADQINIVQASYAGRRAALLFTRGDAAKALP
ncbi:MAG TPA: DUF6702 family protein [Gemmatimonadales bacterium]|nr:DUF6702 family protein [Gemmatimonadales bacterium]